MRYQDLTPLFEGVKFGKKELSHIIENQQDFNIGIEYEFNANSESDNNKIEYVAQILKKENFTNIEEIHPEHDNMVEVVTHTFDSLAKGFNNIKQFFEIANKYNFIFPDTAGMHVSISHKNSNRDVNLIKFLVLLSGDYLHDVFPSRNYVSNIKERMKDVLSDMVSGINKDDFNLKTIILQAEAEIEKEFIRGSDISTKKYISAKISDFFDMNGRVELRFIGGKDYQKRFEDIKYQVIRACYLLSIAFDEDMYNKEYYRSLTKLIPLDYFGKKKSTERKILSGDIDISSISPYKLKSMVSDSSNVEFVLYAAKHTGILSREKLPLIIDKASLGDVGRYDTIRLYAETFNSQWPEMEKRIIDEASFSGNIYFKEYIDTMKSTLGLSEFRSEIFEDYLISNVEEDEVAILYMISYYISMGNRHEWEEGIEALFNNEMVVQTFIDDISERSNVFEKYLSSYVLENKNAGLIVDYIRSVAKEPVNELGITLLKIMDTNSIPRYMMGSDMERWVDAERAFKELFESGNYQKENVRDFSTYLQILDMGHSDAEKTIAVLKDVYLDDAVQRYETTPDESLSEEIASVLVHMKKYGDNNLKKKTKELMSQLDKKGMFD